MDKITVDDMVVWNKYLQGALLDFADNRRKK